MGIGSCHWFSLTLLFCWLMQGAELHFRTETIASDLEGGYQVVAADLNRDGRPDLIALASGMKEVVWFENPGWERHVLATGLDQPINLAAGDLDGAGIPEIVVADGFAMDPRKSAGRVLLLSPRGGDPRQPWQAREIDRLPATHRLRFADLDGSHRRALINAPLAGPAAGPPEFRAKAPLFFYRPPEWKRELIGELEGVLHGIKVVDWDGDGRDEVLTASFLGIHLFKLGRDGLWQRSELAKGNPEPWPRCGASDVEVGRLGGKRFLCSIEPWHGNQVVVYREQDGWRREVIESGLVDGHALAVADLDGDGNDEILAGCRRGPQSVYLYRIEGGRWKRQVLDSGMAAASCAVTGGAVACIDNHRLKRYTR